MCQVSLLNCVPHPLSRLTCLRATAPYYLARPSALRALAPYASSCLTTFLIYVPYRRALCAFFTCFARLIYAPIYFICMI